MSGLGPQVITNPKAYYNCLTDFEFKNAMKYKVSHPGHAVSLNQEKFLSVSRSDGTLHCIIKNVHLIWFDLDPEKEEDNKIIEREMSDDPVPEASGATELDVGNIQALGGNCGNAPADDDHQDRPYARWFTAKELLVTQGSKH